MCIVKACQNGEALLEGCVRTLAPKKMNALFAAEVSFEYAREGEVRK